MRQKIEWKEMTLDDRWISGKMKTSHKLIQINDEQTGGRLAMLTVLSDFLEKEIKKKTVVNGRTQ